MKIGERVISNEITSLHEYVDFLLHILDDVLHLFSTCIKEK